MRTNLEILMRRYKGGGGSPTVISSPPPPTSTSVEVQQAQRQARMAASKRKGIEQTKIAGETGGYKGSTVLGGTIAQTVKNVTLGGV